MQDADSAARWAFSLVGGLAGAAGAFEARLHVCALLLGGDHWGAFYAFETEGAVDGFPGDHVD